MNFISVNSIDDCAICRDTMENTPAVGHKNGGEKHPLHPECVKQWLFTHDDCPTCHVKVNVKSLMNVKERIIKEIGNIKKDAELGLKFGTYLGICFLTMVLTKTTFNLQTSFKRLFAIGYRHNWHVWIFLDRQKSCKNKCLTSYKENGFEDRISCRNQSYRSSRSSKKSLALLTGIYGNWGGIGCHNRYLQKKFF